MWRRDRKNFRRRLELTPTNPAQSVSKMLYNDPVKNTMGQWAVSKSLPTPSPVTHILDRFICRVAEGHMTIVLLLLGVDCAFSASPILSPGSSSAPTQRRAKQNHNTSSRFASSCCSFWLTVEGKREREKDQYNNIETMSAGFTGNYSYSDDDDDDGYLNLSDYFDTLDSGDAGGILDATARTFTNFSDNVIMVKGDGTEKVIPLNINGLCPSRLYEMDYPEFLDGEESLSSIHSIDINEAFGGDHHGHEGRQSNHSSEALPNAEGAAVGGPAVVAAGGGGGAVETAMEGVQNLAAAGRDMATSAVNGLRRRLEEYNRDDNNNHRVNHRHHVQRRARNNLARHGAQNHQGAAAANAAREAAK